MKRTLVRLAVAACLSVAASAASANVYCVVKSTSVYSGPGAGHGSAGYQKAGNTVFGMLSVGGYRKILSPSGKIYFMPNSALARGECKAAPTKRAVVHAAPKGGHCGHCGGKRRYGH